MAVGARGREAGRGHRGGDAATRHSLQAVAPPAEYVPTAQTTGSTVVVAQLNPGGQLEHASALPSAKNPAAHAVCEVLP